ncbi:quinone oxidoreductase [Alloscardovia theropitheci]|uniref:Quinone oxidoreductase n=2 Tax=Alloscardovia theropitheci TaxID=2496842 RepID=A0A4R0QW85_9BIFI|nr:quinone oxidoreductase [Alloscardovia theropitheci]
MRAAVVREPGDPTVLELTDVEIPAMKPGWSLVRVHAFGVNHSEIFTRQGLSPSVEFPRILGIECVGEIVDSEIFSEKTRIVSFMGEMGRAFDGSYAQYVLLPNSQIYPVDSRMSSVDLAAFPETGYTAYGSMRRLNLKSYESVLIRSATSGVGMTFARFAKKLQPTIRLVGSTRNPNKAQALLSAGYDDVITDKDNVLETKQSFDKVLDLVGPKSIRDTFSHVNTDGIVCVTGLLGRQWTIDDLDPIEELGRGTAGHGIYLTGFYSGNVNAQRVQEMFDWIDESHVGALPYTEFDLEHIREAHIAIENNSVIGKIVVRV